MERFVHSALSAMRGAMARQGITAHNLANVTTTGFRGDLAAVNSHWITRDGSITGATSTAGISAIDVRPGAVSPTGRPLDVAIEGNAMLSIQAPDGQPAYSRRGDLTVSPTGLLTDGAGFPVLGDGGPVSIPEGAILRIGDDGTLYANGAEGGPERVIDRLILASPTDVPLTKDADGLLRVADGSVLPADPNARLRAGALESSNVDASAALVDMIEAGRSWDMQMRLISTAREIGDAGSSLMRLTS